MSTRAQVAKQERERKKVHPHLYCKHCLWRLKSGPCPKHAPKGGSK